MAGSFDGRVALVTGGSAGIGRAAAMKFAHESASVVVADITEQGRETAASIVEGGGKAIFVQTDVSKPEDVHTMVEKTIEEYGRLDCAFNNAGIEGETSATVSCSEENFDRVIAVNLKGVWLCMKYEIPQMLHNHKGAIVNVSSVAGLVGFSGLPAYCASKGGVIQLTKAAALEYADKGIRINAICPGGIKTKMLERLMEKDHKFRESIVGMHPVGRLGTPEEVADLAVWLCSDAASFITGYPVAVDGGLVAQ